MHDRDSLREEETANKILHKNSMRVLIQKLNVWKIESCHISFIFFWLLYFVFLNRSHLFLRNWAQLQTNKLNTLVGRGEIYNGYDYRRRVFRHLFLYCLDRVTKRVTKEPCARFNVSRSPRHFRTVRSLSGNWSHQRSRATSSFVAGVSYRVR